MIRSVKVARFLLMLLLAATLLVGINARWKESDRLQNQGPVLVTDNDPCWAAPGIYCGPAQIEKP